MNELNELTTAYIGRNRAHQTFVASLANAKTLMFILTRDDIGALKTFFELVGATKQRAGGGDFAIGIGGRATENTIQMAVHLTRNEIELVQQSPGGFTAQSSALIYREVYRIFESYLADLFEEIAVAEPKVLYSGQTITHEEAMAAASRSGGLHALILQRRKLELTRLGLLGIEKAFDKIGLPLLKEDSETPPEQIADARNRLLQSSAIRNIIEHNQSIVNEEFMKLVPWSNLPLGAIVAITVPELGDALSAASFTADSLNRRALTKYPSIGTRPANAT